MSLPAVAEPGHGARRTWRVLHVITRLDRGGSSDNTILTCLGLDEHGWDVTLAYGVTTDPSPRLAMLAERETIARVVVPSLVRPVHPLLDMRAYRTLRHLMLCGDFDVIHTHSSKAGFIGRRAAANLGHKVVHTPHGDVFEGYFGKSVSRLFLALERRAACWCDRIVVLTDRGRDIHLNRGVGRPEQFVTVPSGVPLEPFREGLPGRETARAALSLPGDSYVIGCVARLVPVKGHAFLLEAAASLAERHPSLRVLLVGDGEERAALEARAASGALGGRVTFTGTIPDPAIALAAMDLFVLPSLNEGQGRAVIEAMAAGLPVVASDVGGLPEVLDGGATGRLVPPADPEALAEAIETLMLSPDAAAALGDTGSRRAERYADTTMIRRIESLYLSLLRDAS